MVLHPVVQAVGSHLIPFFTTAHYHFLLACSGGADSTALLLAFHQLQSVYSFSFSVISVNHNIRPAPESAADSQFVADLCQQLSPAPPCHIEELAYNAVPDCAAQRQKGIEDAARVLRYRAFETYAERINADFIVTAHNQDDVYETLLMRMFQGGSTQALQKMPVQRKHYLRPLSTVTRAEIESFLCKKNISWRTDATNNENQYLRNRIRHFLVPALEKTFDSWESGFDKTLDRIRLDTDFCNNALTEAQNAFSTQHNSAENRTETSEWKQCKTQALSISKQFFYSLPLTLRLRLLEKGCSKLMIHDRISLPLLLRIADSQPETIIHEAGALRFEQRNTALFLFKKKSYTELYHQKSYFIKIIACGLYTYPLGLLSVYATKEGCFIQDTDEPNTPIGPFRLPFEIRGRRNGDRIKMSTGNYKQVKKIFNEWSVDSLSRELLPIIIKDTHLQALYGSPLGYKNWIVQPKTV